MKIIFVGGILPINGLEDIEKNRKGEIWFSSDIHQKKLIQGIVESDLEYHVFSAPLIGAYPMRYRKCVYNPPIMNDPCITNVSFLNIWGIRNFSRSIQLKKAIREYLENIDDKLIVISYMAHLPFLEASCYIKEIRPSTKICYVVPDLPEYMNLNKTTFVYDIAKRIDNSKIERLTSNVDSFILLTEQMKERLKVGDRRYAVVEGLIDHRKIESCNSIPHDTVNIAYTGTLQARYGFRKLVEDFMRDTHENYRLIVCGSGESEQYIRDMSQRDNRIVFKGQVRPERVWDIYNEADVLINPRENDSIYTRYSFPSKIIDYLMTGKPVVACLLDGMPAYYKNFIYEVHNGRYMEAVNIAIGDNKNDQKYKAFIEYALNNLSPDQVIKKIINITLNEDVK